MMISKANHRFRAFLHLWIVQSLLPVSVTYVFANLLTQFCRWVKTDETTADEPPAKENDTYEITSTKQSFTIVLTGAKMSKTLHLVRCLRSFAWDHPEQVDLKIIVLEQQKFQYNATRASRCVDHFHTITSPRVSEERYMDDIYHICQKYDATHFLPVAAPVEAVFDAQLKQRLEAELGMVFLHMNEELCTILDNKHSFGCFLRDTLKIGSLRTHIVHSDDEVRKFNDQLHQETKSGTLKRSLILKNLNYDPVHRLDLFHLPTEPARLDSYLGRIRCDGNPITADKPWQLQEFLPSGQEYAAMIVVRDNKLVTMTCCPSSASQLNYVHVEVPSIRQWIDDFMSSLAESRHVSTGQLCFDFMVVQESSNGTMQEVAFPIECNPRVHTQCSIYNRDDVRSLFGALLLLDASTSTKQIDSMKDKLSRDYEDGLEQGKLNVFWFYNELFKIIPNNIILKYNSDKDLSERSKLLQMDLPQRPNSLLCLTGMVYLPAILLSFCLMLPALLIMMCLAMISPNTNTDQSLTWSDHLRAIHRKSLLFLERLCFLTDNIEGDFWVRDPLPFLVKNHWQVIVRLLATLRTGTEWKKVDFAIGKVVEVGGD